MYEALIKEAVDVDTGEVKVDATGITLKSVAIGSCVVVAAYNLAKKIGAMAHIMLPGSAPEQSLEKSRYAFDAIEQMLNQMFEAGAGTDEIEVCLVGGANVLQKENDSICESNIKSISTILAEKNVPVRGSVLGGTKRKSVFLDVGRGCVSYIEGDEKEKTLWQASQ